MHLTQLKNTVCPVITMAWYMGKELGQHNVNSQADFAM